MREDCRKIPGKMKQILSKPLAIPGQLRHGTVNDDLYLDPLTNQGLTHGYLHSDTVLTVKDKNIGGTREGCSTIPSMVEKI